MGAQAAYHNMAIRKFRRRRGCKLETNKTMVAPARRYIVHGYQKVPRMNHFNAISHVSKQPKESGTKFCVFFSLNFGIFPSPFSDVK